MKIFVEKDILEINEGVIVHCVNCQAVMGSGIALSIRNKYPVVYEDYKIFCKGQRPERLLGEVHFSVINDKLTIANLFGQLNFGGDKKKYVSYGAFEKAAPVIKEYSDKYNLDVYCPYKIGSDRAGGNFDIISLILQEVIPNVTFCKLPTLPTLTT